MEIMNGILGNIGKISTNPKRKEKKKKKKKMSYSGRNNVNTKE